MTILFKLNPNNKVEHIAPATEEAINTMLTSWLTFINNRQFPFLFKATLAYYFFENTHPFYDGNGRTGCYILSKYLSRKLDRFSGLIINKKSTRTNPATIRPFQKQATTSIEPTAPSLSTPCSPT